MFSQLIIALTFGIFLGIITGLIPGFHINLLSVILLGFYPAISGFFSPVAFCVIIVSMAIANVFLSFIPAVFLGAPNSENALGVLPGHALLMRGQGLKAVKLLCLGCLFSLLLGFCLLPVLILVIPIIYNYVKNAIGWMLLVVVISMLLREKTLRNKIWALIVLTTSGILGIIVFNMNLKNSLVPMLSGLFGVGMLLTSILRNTKIPEQLNEFSYPDNFYDYAGDEASKSFPRTLNFFSRTKGIIKPVLVSLFSGAIVCIFPAIGPSQAAIIGSEFIRQTDENYLLLVGGINSINMLVSIITLNTIGKARNGVIVALGEILKPNYAQVFFFGFAAVLSAALALFLALFFAKRFSEIISKINYKMLSLSIILFILIMALALSGFLGMIVLIVSAAIGIIPNITGIGRNHAMGCLLLPVIVMYLL